MFKLALICGGPSKERGISLNSARSVLDHLSRDGLEIRPLYVDHEKNFYAISPRQLYSNTPSDFDFKLAQTARALNESDLVEFLKECDLTFPVIHGAFGEDGALQAFLEKNDIPYVGSDRAACEKMFAKHRATQALKSYDYPVLDNVLITPDLADQSSLLERFFKEKSLTRAVVKPANGGSSIGVFLVHSAAEAMEKIAYIFDQDLDHEIVVEEFCEGKEFTVIVLQNEKNKPVALLPTEISFHYEGEDIFNYRRKYLPTCQVAYHCPARFDDRVVVEIRRQAEDIFTKLGMRDFVRLDGWLTDKGDIIFPDLNPISGMEQNSFLFHQGARVGFTHAGIFEHILQTACRRYDLNFPSAQEKSGKRKNVRVIFGGDTAERQVSLMSGTNVWLKLRQSELLKPEPYLLDKKGDVWHLPYAFTLSHTVEEIVDHCLTASSHLDRLIEYATQVRKELGLDESHLGAMMFAPRRMSFDKFMQEAKEEEAFVFLGLHGGDGENGAIQAKLEDAGLLYNGSGSNASQLCMDKHLTGEAITRLADPMLITAPKVELAIAEFSGFSDSDYATYWEKMVQKLGAASFIIKPRSDGCSAGVVHLYEAQDLQKYVQLVQRAAEFIPAHSFRHQAEVIEMAVSSDGNFLIESFIEVDYLRVQKNELVHKPKTGWIELTAGVLEQDGKYHALNPSITIAEGAVLSLEEKFQGGTGVNITPPPVEIVPAALLDQTKKMVEKAAKALGIGNYARIDIFLNVKSGKVIVIEANSLPGLTPSTVIFHQALAEMPAMVPLAFLEKIVQLTGFVAPVRLVSSAVA